jgi:chromosome segregation ATPase
MEAEAVKNEAAVAFRPILREVRALQRDMRALQQEIEERETLVARMGRDGRDDDAAEQEARIAELAERRDALAARIPATWDDTFAEFRQLENAEVELRRQYRRAGDDSAEAAMEMSLVLGTTEALRALEPRLREMLERIGQEAPEDLVDPITDLRAAFADVEGASDVRGAVNDARSALRGREPNPAEAAAAMEEALRLHAAQIAWRDRAETELRPGLEAYLEEITRTVGARQRERMPRSMALSIAACESNHRDLSLHF